MHRADELSVTMNSGDNQDTATFEPWVVLLVLVDAIVILFVSAIFLQLDGATYKNHQISVNFIQVGAVLILAFLDVSIRHRFFQGFKTVRSISIDILTFSIVSRIGLLVTGSEAQSEYEWAILLGLFVLFGVGLFVYRELFVDPFKEKLRTELSRAIGKIDLNEGVKIINLCIAHKHPDLWGVDRGKEVKNVNELLTRCVPGATRLTDEDVKIDKYLRLAVVAILGLISIVAVWLTGFSIISLK